MRLPNARLARAQREKITGYLLAENPDSGRGKPGFFAAFGFSADNWQALADALLAVGQGYDVVDILETSFGIKYVIEGQVETPDGRNPRVRTVWQIDWGKDCPILGRVDTKNLTQRREGAKGAKMRLLRCYPDFLTVIPAKAGIQMLGDAVCAPHPPRFWTSIAASA